MMRTLAVGILATVLTLVCFQPCHGTPGLAAADEKTIDGVWESVDFGMGRFYRLEFTWPSAVLIVTSGQPNRRDFVFRAKQCVLEGGNVSLVGKDQSSGLVVEAKGRVRSNGLVGGGAFTMTVSGGDKIHLPSPWEERERQFWKRESWSRLDELKAAGERAAQIAKGLP
jgi:hypothetical protein